MSELVPVQRNQAVRWHLLASVSAVALLVSVATAPVALADDVNHFYFELGGQYGMEAGGSSGWFLPFAAPGGGGEGGEVSVQRVHSATGPNGAAFPIRPVQSWDFDGAVKLQPADSDLIFKLAIQYGRTAQRDEVAQLTQPTASGTGHYTGFARHRESHAIIDFQVGKDFGLGMFGYEGSSVFSAGIRYAHFTARTDTAFYTSTKDFQGSGATRLQRSFVGAGPMVSWQASAPLTDDENGSFSIDWGADAAVLFGRQKANLTLVYDTGYVVESDRDNSVTVPNVGGFAGLSWHPAESSLQLSFGYKVDAYFNALDGGIAAQHQIDRVTHGPFLKIGIQAN